MRHRLPLILPVLALAACGGGGQGPGNVQPAPGPAGPQPADGPFSPPDLTRMMTAT
jgi:hypothetical protein